MVRNAADVPAEIVPTPPFKHVGGVKFYSMGHSVRNYGRAIYDSMSSSRQQKMPTRP